MLPPGYLTRYETTAKGISIYIQSPTIPGKITAYNFPDTKHGEQTLRRYLDYIVRKYSSKRFSNKMTNTEIMDALIFTFKMKGLIKDEN